MARQECDYYKEGGGGVNLSRYITSKNAAYTGSPVTYNLDYTLTEDAWIYIFASSGGGAITIKADNVTIYNFANYASTSTIGGSTWVKLPKGTRLTSTVTAADKIYYIELVVYGVA